MNVQVGTRTREQPPFRAEHIGSLLRPAALLEQRARFARSEISQSDLTAAENTAISEAIVLQQRLGLRFVTDGEFRRRSYHSFFYQQLGDLSIDTLAGTDAKGAEGGGGRGAQPVAVIKSRVRWTHPINVDDFNFLKNKTTLLPKITIPGPCALHFRGGNAAVLAHAYRDVDQFWNDTVEAFSKELSALAQAGCRYVQIDETAFAKFGDPDVQTGLAARGDDWSKLIDVYIVSQTTCCVPRRSRYILVCIFAEEIVADIGMQKAVMKKLRSDFSMRLKFRFISSNTTRRGLVISRHSASFPSISRSCSG